MAYMNQERKAQIQPAVKAILKKYNVKGRLGVDNHSTLVLNITEGEVDFLNNYAENRYAARHPGNTPNGYINVNVYHFDSHFSGQALKFIKEVYAAMMVGNHDNSDLQSDYFDVGWYVDINIGKWENNYVLTA